VSGMLPLVVGGDQGTVTSSSELCAAPTHAAW